ncbi:MAG: hypothetical protein WC001_06530 [Desulfurivibrionaceae bacterium]
MNRQRRMWKIIGHGTNRIFLKPGCAPSFFHLIFLIICFVLFPGLAYSDDKPIVLDQLLNDIGTCTFNQRYIDLTTNRLSIKQLENIGLKNPENVGGLAIYNMRATYLGMPVSAFWIPSASDDDVNYPSFGVEISMKYGQVRKIIRKKFGRDFRPLADGQSLVTKSGTTTPELEASRKDSSKTIFQCFFE